MGEGSKPVNRSAIISGTAQDAIPEGMFDMDTLALLRACEMFSVLLIGLRGISDGAAHIYHIDDWTEYVHVSTRS